MDKLDNKYFCEVCGKEIIVDFRKHKSTPPRFCSSICAHIRKPSNFVKEKIRNGVKSAWKDLPYKCEHCNRKFKTEKSWREHEQKCTRENRISLVRRQNWKIKREKRFQKQKVKIHNIEIDITLAELEQYRKTHLVCEICGRSIDDLNNGNSTVKRKNLSIDHDHKTLKFRGLLCMHCNANLGWYEKYQTEINDYLKSHTK